MLNKTKKILLGLVCVMSANVFAQTLTVRTCDLTQWCAMPRTSDVAQFYVSKAIGENYDCTFTAEGENNDSVMALVAGSDGFVTEHATIGVMEGRSAIVTIRGKFKDSDGGTLSFRRSMGMSSSKKVYIMCEKQFH